MIKKMNTWINAFVRWNERMDYHGRHWVTA